MPIFQDLGQQHHATAVPGHDLQTVVTLAAEDINVTRIRVRFKRRRDQRRKGVDTLPKVNRPRSDQDPQPRS